MARLIPNEATWLGFVPWAAGAPALNPPYDDVAVSDITGAVDVTPFLISLNASAQGNTVPTPAFDSLFETTVPGTTSASFTADFYRDDVTDTAWDTFTRGAKGHFCIARYGGSGTSSNVPILADEIEVWPVAITSRTMQNMTSNQVLMFTVTCSVPDEPAEAVAIIA